MKNIISVCSGDVGVYFMQIREVRPDYKRSCGDVFNARCELTRWKLSACDRITRNEQPLCFTHQFDHCLCDFTDICLMLSIALTKKVPILNRHQHCLVQDATLLLFKPLFLKQWWEKLWCWRCLVKLATQRNGRCWNSLNVVQIWTVFTMLALIYSVTGDDND